MSDTMIRGDSRCRTEACAENASYRGLCAACAAEHVSRQAAGDRELRRAVQDRAWQLATSGPAPA